MTIDQLFRAITDIEFQYKRFVKTKDFDGESLVRFDIISAEICEQIIKMALNDTITEEAKNLGRIDINYLPQVGFGRKVLNAMTFGYSTKKYLQKERLNYLYGAIHARNRLFQLVELHLIEE
jgi:hypothetical protein